MVASPEKTGIKQDTRFKPGKSGNPTGRPKGIRNAEGLLDEALKAVQQKRSILKEPCLCTIKYSAICKEPCVTIDEHFVRQAFLDSSILTAFQKKRIPDLQHSTGETQQPIVFQIIQYGAQPMEIARV